VRAKSRSLTTLADADFSGGLGNLPGATIELEHISSYG
jgi:hypothetical protein